MSAHQAGRLRRTSPMNDERNDSPVPNKTLLDRIVQSLGGEPQNRDDLLAVVDQAQQRGLLDIDALDMIHGVFEVAEMQVRDIMVPRSQMVVVEHDDTIADMLPVIIESGHSRFPVIADSRDEVIGVLLAKDLLRHFRDQPDAAFEMEDVLRQAIFIPESKRLNTLLKEFRSSRNHMAIVVDEYGGVAGLVTIEDVIEQIIGDIDDEHDAETDAYMRPRGDGSYAVQALTPIEEFNEFFNVSFDDEAFDTIGGLLMHHLGHMPKRGEVTRLNGFRFKVMSADSRRIHMLRVNQEGPQTSSGDGG